LWLIFVGKERGQEFGIESEDCAIQVALQLANVRTDLGLAIDNPTLAVG